MCVTNDARLPSAWKSCAFMAGNRSTTTHSSAGISVSMNYRQRAQHQAAASGCLEHGPAEECGLLHAAFGRAQPADCRADAARRAGARHIYNQYVIRVSQRDALRAKLSAAGVSTEIYYRALHLQQCFAYLAEGPATSHSPSAPRQTPGAADLSGAADTQLQYVVDMIAAHLAGNGG